MRRYLLIWYTVRMSTSFRVGRLAVALVEVKIIINKYLQIKKGRKVIKRLHCQILPLTLSDFLIENEIL